MQENPSTPATTSVGDLSQGTAFRYGAGAVAHIRTSSSTGTASACRLGDGVVVDLALNTVVTPAPNATFTLFP